MIWFPTQIALVNLCVPPKKTPFLHRFGISIRWDLDYHLDIFEAEKNALESQSKLVKITFSIYKRAKKLTSISFIFFVIAVIIEFFYGVYFVISNG